MISGVIRLLLFRVLGARVLLLLTVLGWIRNRLRGRSRASQERGAVSEYRRR